MAEQCEFYYYDCGYCCELKREHEGSSSINHDTVKKYCWGYHYEDCPRWKEEQNRNSSGCYLTSACVEAKQLPDDCYELTTLRIFRDTYMCNIPGGAADIAEYYHIAPAIVANIKELPNAMEIFDRIYYELVMPCVKLIEEGKNTEAYEKYKAYTRSLQIQYL